MENTNKNSKGKKVIWGLVVSIILIILDQITKMLAVTHLKGANPIAIIENVFCLQYLENRGAAFGILQDKKIFFILITIVVMIAIVYIYINRIPAEKKFRFLDVICVLFFAGAIGNFIDRLMQNYVVDFFYFELINFPIFNVADIYVTVAAIAMIVLGLFYYKEEDYEKIFPSKKSDLDKKK